MNMLKSVFVKGDFKLCDVRVPNGCPQSQTHAGIAYYNGKYFLTCSPYPVKKYSWIEGHWLSFLQKISHGRMGNIPDAEKFENPLLYVGKGEAGKAPVKFDPVSPFPLMDTPEPVYGQPAYHSDPDIFIENGNVYILNRTYYRKQGLEDSLEKEVLISLISGIFDDKGYHLRNIQEFKKSSCSMISPCLIKYKDDYVFTQLETNSAIDGHSFDGLYLQKSKTIDGFNNIKEYEKIELESNGLLPWHMSLFTYKEDLYAVLACVEKGDKSHIWQMLGMFSQDLSRLEIFPRPLTDYNSYRGSAIVVDDVFVLYSTTLNDYVKGSNSVDGRDVIMASKPMEEVLKLKNIQ